MEDIFYLNDTDVVSVDKNHNGGCIVVTDTTFKVNAFMATMKSQVHGDTNPKQELFEQGISCEVLRPGCNWKKGKLKIRLEFCPDEPESPLDDIRKTLKAEIS